MLTLEAAQTLRGKAGANTALVVSVFGIENGATGNTFKLLAQVTLTNAASTIYTVPASTSTIVKAVVVQSIHASDQTVELWVGGAADANRIFKGLVLAGGSVRGGGEAWQRLDANGSEIVVTATSLDLPSAKEDGTLVGTLADVTSYDFRHGVDVVQSGTEAQISVDESELAVPQANVTNLVSDLAGKQSLDAGLTSLAARGSAADKGLYTTAVDTWAEFDLTAAGRALLDDASAAAQRTTLGLVIGTDVEAHDSDLTTFAGLTPGANDVAQYNGGWRARSMANLLTDLAAAPLASPGLTGNPTAPTPTDDDNDTSIATTAFVKSANRARARNAALNILAENVPVLTTIQTAAIATQVVYFGLVGLLKGDLVTNILINISTAAAGATPTKVEFGLYDSSGNLLATTGDIKAHANFASTGFQAFPLTGAYTITATGGYYIAILVNGTWATTNLIILRAQNALAGGTAVSGGVRGMARQASQTALPNPATFANLEAGAGYWMGCN